MSIINYSGTRTFSLALVGIACTIFAVTVLINDPIWHTAKWVPMWTGIFAGAAIFVMSVAFPKSVVEAAWDELTSAKWNQALKLGYWIAVILYPVFGIFLGLNWVSFNQSFAAMGSLTGGLPLLYFCYLELKA